MTRNVKLSRSLIALLTVAFCAQTPLVNAEIVDTDQLLTAQDRTELDRAKIQSFVERANVMERMQAMGVSGVVAEDRVASMNAQEVHALAQRIDSMPAGGNLGSTDLIIILLIAILVVIAL